MNREARNDAIAGVLILFVVLIFGLSTGKIYVDPLDPGFSARDFPIAILVLITLLAIGLLRKAIVELAKSGWRLFERGEANDILRYVVPMVAIAFIYVSLWEMFQYPASTVVAAAAALVVYGNSGIRRLVLAPIIVTGVYYVLFYGILGLFEEPGTVWSYSNQGYFRPLRDALGLF
ncbi:MAG: hypothetical protein KAG66_12420 [Methylococcales bacterium]|nr:hypothetical protein [Methylococcales bacterium]